MSGSSSKSTSKPQDMTPQAFKNLQSPFADTLASLLGFSQQQPAAPAYSGMTANGVPSQGGTATRTTPTYGSNRGGGSWQNGPQSDMGVWRDGQRVPAPGTPTSNPLTQALSGYAPTGNISDVLRGIPGYQGPLTADMTGNENALLEQLMGQSAVGGDPNSVAQNYLRQVISGQTGSGYSPEGNNPFMAAAIEAAQRPTFQALEETLSRTLPGRFTQAGQFINPQGSSAFDRAAALAGRAASDTAGDIATNISYEGFNAERDRQFQAQEAAAGRRQDAATALPGVSETEINSTIANLQAQALPRLIQEMGIERGLQEFQNRMGNLLTTLGIAGGATSPTVANSSKQSSASFGLK